MNYKYWLMGFLYSGCAFAEEQAAGPTMAGGGALTQGLLLAGFVLIFYFLFIRPQNKRAKEHQQLISGLQKDDEVITSGGILARVMRVTDNFLIVMIAEGVEIPIQRNAVATLVPKGTMKAIEK